MFKRLKGKFGNEAPRHQHAPVRDQVDRQPAPHTVAKKPQDLGYYDAIISGTAKGAKIHLSAHDARHIIVLRNGNSAIIVASTDISGTRESTKLFTEVRRQLAVARLEFGKTIWAEPNLILDHGKLKDVGNVHLDDGVADANETEHAKRLHVLIDYGFDENASDLHIEVRYTTATVRFRIDGAMELWENGQHGQMIAAQARQTVAIAFNKLLDAKSNSGSMFNGDEFLSSTLTRNTGVYQVKMRCECIPAVNGFDFIARFAREGDSQVSYTFETLGYTQTQIRMIKTAIEVLKGLIIFAGIPGSGKTVSVQTCLESVEEKEKLKIVTIDDPVEKILPFATHTAIQTDISDEEESGKAFGEAVKHWLRGNPDVVSLGEIRGIAGGGAALEFAEVGCLTFGTLHCHSALGIFNRLTSPRVGIDVHALTAPGIMNLFVRQALVPKLCDDCKTPLADMPLPVKVKYQTVSKRFGVDVSGVHFRNRSGACPHCKGRGTKGRTVVAEMVAYDEDLLKLILAKDYYGAQAHWLSKGDGRFDTDNMDGKSIFEHAFYKALNGVIDAEMVDRRFGNYSTFVIRHPIRGEQGPEQQGLATA